MRVVLVAAQVPPAGHGGTSRYAEWAAESLVNQGDDVLLLAGSSETRVQGVRFAQIAHLGPLPRNAPTLKKVAWHARDQWRPVVHVAVRRYLREFAPDLVWTNEIQGLSAAVFSAIDQERLPHVHTAHDYSLFCSRMGATKSGAFCGGKCPECRPQRLIRGGLIMRNLSAMICVSDYVRCRHIEAGFPAEKLHTIRNGSQPGTSRQRSQSSTPCIGYIGTLTRHKGIETLLEAFAGAPPHWRLKIAGGGDLGAIVAAAAANDARILAMGEIEGGAKEAFFESIDVLVVPSLYEEPGAFVVTEAAARGIPAVVSDRGGLPEAPEATTFPSGDAKLLCRAIAALVDGPDRLAAASGRLVAARERFLWERHVRDVRALLESAAGGTVTGSGAAPA